MRNSFILLFLLLLGGCANGFLAQPSVSEYSDSCRFEIRNKRFAEAERDCYLAFINSDWANNPRLKSENLYTLGTIKQQLGKFAEAELLLAESLQIEESLSSPPKVIGQRLITLSASFAGQGKWAEGTQALERLIPIATQFSRQERLQISRLLEQYSIHLKRANQQIPLAKRFATTASILSLN